MRAQNTAEAERACDRAMRDRTAAHLAGLDSGPAPLECYEACDHACACCMQYERAHGPVSDAGWRGWLPEALGCSEACAEWEVNR